MRYWCSKFLWTLLKDPIIRKGCLNIVKFILKMYNFVRDCVLSVSLSIPLLNVKVFNLNVFIVGKINYSLQLHNILIPCNLKKISHRLINPNEIDIIVHKRRNLKPNWVYQSYLFGLFEQNRFHVKIAFVTQCVSYQIKKFFFFIKNCFRYDVNNKQYEEMCPILRQ